MQSQQSRPQLKQYQLAAIAREYMLTKNHLRELITDHFSTWKANKKLNCMYRGTPCRESQLEL